MATKDSVTTSTQRFRELFNITKSWCTIDSEINYRSIVQQKTERWNILLDIWKKNSRRVGRNVFLNPLFHIVIGRYLNRPSRNQVPLLHKIETTLINDSEAFEAWSQTEIFKDAFQIAFVNRLAWNSFNKFQVSQGMLRLLRGKNIPVFENTPVMRTCSSRELTDIAQLEATCNRMKTQVSKLLPASCNWEPDQWVNTIFVCNAINSAYGLDNHHWDLQGIIDMIDYANNPNSYPNIVSIAFIDINYIFMKTLFDKNTDNILLNLLLESIRLVTEDSVKLAVRNTWFYGIIEKWTYDKSHPYCRQAKKIIFDMNTRLNVS